MKNNDIWTDFLSTLDKDKIQYIFEQKYHPGYIFSRHSPSYEDDELENFVKKLPTMNPIEVIPFMGEIEIKDLLNFINCPKNNLVQDNIFECLRFFFDDTFLEESLRKLLMLLFSKSVESQTQGIILFESLSIEKQRYFVENCITQSDYTDYSDSMHFHIQDEEEDIEITRFHFISPFEYSLSQAHYFVDWMLAITQDPRWIQAKHLYVNHCIAIDSFTHEHVHTLLAYLLIHPSWKEMNDELPNHFLIINGCEMHGENLLQSLKENGVQGSTFDDVYSSLVNLREVTLIFRFHPFLEGLPIEKANFVQDIYEYEDETYMTVSLAEEYNKHTGKWLHPYYDRLPIIRVNSACFTKLKELQIINAPFFHSCINDSTILQDISIKNCHNLYRFHSTTILNSIRIMYENNYGHDIPDLNGLRYIDVPKPTSCFFLDTALTNGLGDMITEENWNHSFDKLMFSQQDRVTMILRGGYSESNRFFQCDRSILDRIVFSKSWMLNKLYRFIIHQELFPLFITRADKHYQVISFDGLFLPKEMKEEHLSFIYTGIDSFPDCDWESIPSYLTLGSCPSATMASEDLQEQFVSLIEEQNFPFNNDEELFDFFGIKDFLEVFVQTIDSVTLQDWLKTIETDRKNKKS